MKVIDKAVKLSRDLKLMIAFNAMQKVLDLYLITFFTSFIMHNSTNEIIAVAKYNLFYYVIIAIGFFAVANWVKCRNKVAILRFNLIPKLLLLLLIIFLGDRAVEYVVPLGILYGISGMFYYLPMHVMLHEKATPAQARAYVGLNSGVSFITKIVAPVLLGLFISTGSYAQVAYALLAISAIGLILTCCISSSHHRSQTPVDFAGFFRCMMRFPIIRTVFFAEMLRGFTLAGAMSTIITMYTVYMFSSDLNLGILTTLFSLVAALVCWTMGRYIRQNMYRHVMLIAILIVAFSMGGFLIWTTPIMFLLYRLGDASAIQIVDQICTVNSFNTSKSKCVTKNHRVEYFVFRDSALFIGRWIGYVGLMYIGVFGSYDWLRWYLAIITGAIILMGYLAIKISPHIRSR